MCSFMTPDLNYRKTKWIDFTLTISQASRQAIFVAWSPARDHSNITISTPSLENSMTKVHSQSLTWWLKWSASTLYIIFHFFVFPCRANCKVGGLFNCWDLPFSKIWNTVQQENKIMTSFLTVIFSPCCNECITD